MQNYSVLMSVYDANTVAVCAGEDDVDARKAMVPEKGHRPLHIVFSLE